MFWELFQVFGKNGTHLWKKILEKALCTLVSTFHFSIFAASFWILWWRNVIFSSSGEDMAAWQCFYNCAVKCFFFNRLSENINKYESTNSWRESFSLFVLFMFLLFLTFFLHFLYFLVFLFLLYFAFLY